MTDYLHALAMRTAAAKAMGERQALISREQVADLILALPLEADHAALLAEVKRLPKIAALIEAATRQRDNIARWIATGEPATPDESRSIATGLFDALLALETP